MHKKFAPLEALNKILKMATFKMQEALIVDNFIQEEVKFEHAEKNLEK
jgi:hypothetical protein